METLNLKATPREILGKKVKSLRRKGVTPAHLFGHNIASVALQCDTGPLERLIAQAGTTRPVSLRVEGDNQPRSVLLREIQRDALSGTLLHVDLYQMTMTEKLNIDIPIVLVGEAPAMKAKGRTLLHPLARLSIRCLPDKIPPQIEVDLSSLTELDQSIHVKDLKLDPDITVETEPEQLVAKVVEAAKEEVVAPKAEEVVAAEAAPEAAPAPEAAKEKKPK